VLILVVQALVIVSVLLFILSSLSKRAVARVRAPEDEGSEPSVRPAPAAPPSEGGEARAPQVVAGDGSALATLPGEEAAVPQGAETAGLASTAPAASGVMSLSDIEELVDVEEIGEAEVAGEEEAEEIHDMESLGEGDGEEAPGELEEIEEFDEPEDISEAAVAAGVSTASEPETIGVELAEEVEELGSLEEAVEAEPFPAPTADGMDETIIDDRGIVTGFRGTAKGDEGEASVQKTLPELEALVTAGRPVRTEKEEGAVELLPTIPEELYREKAGVKRDDELSSLITELETEAETPGEKETPEKKEEAKKSKAPRRQEAIKKSKAPRKKAAYNEKNADKEVPGTRMPSRAPRETAGEEDLPDLSSPEGLKLFIKGVLRTIGITKGALLTQTGGGGFEPYTIFGFSKTTKKKLVFDAGENLYEDFLKNGKTLFILDKVFKSKEVAKKFDRADSSKIRSLVVSPVVKTGEVKGILIVGVSKGKKVEQEPIIEMIKKIKEVIVRVF
jgi:hypothetical protein